MKVAIIKQRFLASLFSKPVSKRLVGSRVCILKSISLVLLGLYSTTLLAFDYFIVNREAEVYSAPHGSELLTRLSEGEVLLEIDKKGAWSQVFFLSPEKKPLKGWMLSDRLTAQQQGKENAQVAGYTHTAAVDSLRLRQGPGGNYGVVGTLHRDQQVTELKREGDWVNVSYRDESGNLADAWTAGRFLRSVAPQSQTVISKADKFSGQFRIRGENVNFRSGPGTGFPVVGQVSAPQQVEVIGSQKGWMNISLQQSGVSRSGWISQRFLDSVK